jgi:hypothetical protein
MNESLIETIKSRGYWRINFQPTGNPSELSLGECKNLIEQNQVSLRGWSYPFFFHGDAPHYGFENHNNFFQGWINKGDYKEFWRIYKSSQFLHYSAVNEDWWTPETRGQRFHDTDVEPGTILNFVGSLNYYITEIMEFLTRLHKSGLYQEGVKVNISLNNTRGRKLTSFEFMRDLSFPKITAVDNIVFEKILHPQELVKPAPDIAIEPLLHFYELFNFGDVSVELLLKKDQQTLYGYGKGN